MPGLAAILPVLTAGFLFVVIHYKTRLLASQAEGQRLFFMCASAGLVMSALAHIILSLIPDEQSVFLTRAIPDQTNRQHIFTFLLGPATAGIANILYTVHYWIRVDDESKSYASNAWEWAISAHIRRSGSPLRRMLVQAVDSNGEQLVLLSLSSRKVYCGAIRRLPSPTSGDEFVEIIPMFSATRNKDSLKFEDKIDYPAFHLWRLKLRISLLEAILNFDGSVPGQEDEREIAQAELAQRRDVFNAVAATAPDGYAENLNIDLWAKVIPVREIDSLSLYDQESNDRWFSSPPPNSQPHGETPQVSPTA